MEIKEKDGHVVLIVEDTEVFDFVEDFLIEEHDLEYSFLETGKANGCEVYTLHFEETDDPTRLQAAVDAIDPEELQRIWNLNN